MWCEMDVMNSFIVNFNNSFGQLERNCTCKRDSNYIKWLSPSFLHILIHIVASCQLSFISIFFLSFGDCLSPPLSLVKKKYHALINRTVGGAVVSWLVRSTPERAVRARTLLAGDIVLSSWARHFTLTVPLFTQMYKWVPANIMLGVNPVMD